MVRALGHSSLVVIMALTLLPSMPTLPMYAASPQSVQYSHLVQEMTGRRKWGGGAHKKHIFVILIMKTLILLFCSSRPCLCVLIPIFRINGHGTRSADSICDISICETFRQQLLLVPPV